MCGPCGRGAVRCKPRSITVKWDDGMARSAEIDTPTIDPKRTWQNLTAPLRRTRSMAMARDADLRPGQWTPWADAHKPHDLEVFGHAENARAMTVSCI